MPIRMLKISVERSATSLSPQAGTQCRCQKFTKVFNSTKLALFLSQYVDSSASLDPRRDDEVAKKFHPYSVLIVPPSCPTL
jgi:hypothetical protein